MDRILDFPKIDSGDVREFGWDCSGELAIVHWGSGRLFSEENPIEGHPQETFWMVYVADGV
jgi:hypothetical protein